MGELKLKGTETKVKRIDSNLLYRLRMKYQRSQVTDITTLNKAIDAQLTAIVEQGAKPDEFQLDIMTDMLGFVIENIERQEEEKAARERSAEEWRQLEYEYATVREGKYSMLTIEALPEYDETQYKECAHRFCITAFKVPRKNALYCCDDCRKKEHASIKEFDRTSKVYTNGTYLPIKAYLSNRTGYMEELYMEHERLFDEETLQMIANDDSDEFDPTANAANRERRMRSTLIDSEVSRGRAPGEVVTYKLDDMTTDDIEKTFAKTRIKRINPSSFSR